MGDALNLENKMTYHRPMHRRTFLAAGFGMLAFPLPAPAAPTRIAVTKDPNCSCCSGWVDHLKKADFDVSVTLSSDLSATKSRLGIPDALAACHTAEIEGYAIEGHVPAAAIRRLLAKRPAAKGLAVPGMPAGSPGMEVQGTASEVYDVVIFGEFGQRRFARYRGSVEVT
jgi:hypothetical protein